MKIAFQFWYYKAVHPTTQIAELSKKQWNEFVALEDEYARKQYIQWLFKLDYLDVWRMWCIPLDPQSELIVKEGTEVLKREPTKPEVIYREMLKKYEHTTYGRQVLCELDMAVDSDEDLYKFVMYAYEHKRRFHICYDKWEDEQDKTKIIFVGRLAADTGYMYLYK